MTKQEMFDLAVRGLRSQDWTRAYSVIKGRCVYETENGERCAFGWIDRSLTAFDQGNVYRLNDLNIGLAANMGLDELSFAYFLQRAHDDNPKNEDMELAFQKIAKDFDLIWPKE